MQMTQPNLALKKKETIRLPIQKPFHFRCTLWKPSHFSTDLEQHTATRTWRTFRFGAELFGVRFDKRDDYLLLHIFSKNKLSDESRARLIRRIETAYGLSEDLSEFYKAARTLPALVRPIRALKGMRISCPESIFEIAIISLLLQNTTIQRSTQMTRNVLQRFGRSVSFDGRTLWCFPSPADLAGVPEDILRTECRLGYRAKYLPAFAQFFLANDDDALRELKREEVILTLQSIKGVGPYTAGVIASHALRDPDALALDVWNTKLAGKAFFGRENIKPDHVRKFLQRQVPGHAGLALLYLVESEYLKSPMTTLTRS